jgi:hypothetical protein
VYKYNANFEGKWRTIPTFDSLVNETVTSEIVIDGADGLFNNSCRQICGDNLCDCLSQQVGKAVMNTSKTQMKIGSSAAYPITIQQEPYQDNAGNWVMKVEGLTFYKQ